MEQAVFTLALEPGLTVRVGERYWLEAHAEIERDNWLDTLARVALDVWPGKVASLDGNGGLVNNLRVWENLILPAWYHHGDSLAGLETALLALFAEVGVDEAQAVGICQGLPAALGREQRQELALLRAALLEPSCLVIDGDWYAFLAYGRGLACRPLFERMTEQAVTFVAAAYPPPSASFQRLLIGDAAQLTVSDRP
ncbi:hypothetical protein N8I74_13470 [Chitiniphilus purpureus]|uniref:PH domain-containing protein n=1 Tax=Chitiniphilus purpureus TaxID=2981137 RepID=A0ABY6DLH3_9NEIS|nr:hypothetical protein [Chitiniphilus sp. CD1]UXY14321.1 hypothetical protein N8I74_13470 [Chitiniphilus sp. CD1]